MTFRDGINKGEAYFDWTTYQYIDPNAGNTTGLNDGTITSADIMQINSYYPFGLNMEGNWNGAAGNNKMQYNGKEWNDDFGLGWNDYGARWYQPDAPHWLSIDPLAEKHLNNSPYNYTLNNPIKYIDPNGMDNVLYILTLANVSQELVDKAITNANSYLRSMGINTLVVRASSSFDISKLDATDGMFLIGNNRQSVTNYAKSNTSFKGIVDNTFLTGDKNDFHSLEYWNKSTTPSSEFPEITSQNLGVVAIDGIDQFTKNMQVKKEDGTITFGLKSSAEALGLIMVHSMGHQAGIKHGNNPYFNDDIEYSEGFMATGNGLQLHLNGTNMFTLKTPVTSVYQLFNGDTTGNNNTPRTPSNVIDKIKIRFQPNNQQSNPTANNP